jgi:hypothetical protein
MVTLASRGSFDRAQGEAGASPTSRIRGLEPAWRGQNQRPCRGEATLKAKSLHYGLF